MSLHSTENQLKKRLSRPRGAGIRLNCPASFALIGPLFSWCTCAHLGAVELKQKEAAISDTPAPLCYWLRFSNNSNALTEHCAAFEIPPIPGSLKTRINYLIQFNYDGAESRDVHYSRPRDSVFIGE